MTLLSKPSFLSCFATLLIFSAHLSADESGTQDSGATIQKHVSVRSREMDPELREWIRNKRLQEREEEEQKAQSMENGQMIRKTRYTPDRSHPPFKLAPRDMLKPHFTLAAYAYPVNCHWLTSIADSNHTIEIEDGSHWEISPSDMYTVMRNWRREDSLVITPNYSWLGFNSYDYYITNKNSNTYVKANLVIGPLDHGPYSHWITGIDYVGGHVYLENQMIWCVDPEQKRVIMQWSIDDHIILGVYDSWFSNYDHILINVNWDNHVRVKQY